MRAEVEDDRELPRKSRISPLGCALAFGVCFIVITQLLGHMLTARLTIHNRTTEPLSVTTDAFGGYPNYVGACSSGEFRWSQQGSRLGWEPAATREFHGGAVEIAIPVDPWFEVQVPANHHVVLVTSEQVAEIEESSPLPPCSGVPPSEEDSSPIAPPNDREPGHN